MANLDVGIGGDPILLYFWVCNVNFVVGQYWLIFGQFGSVVGQSRSNVGQL